jgi:type II secretory pathway component PulJ
MEYAILAISILASGLSGIAVFLLKDLKRSSDVLHTRVTRLEVHVAENYVRTDQLANVITGVVRGLR